MKKLGMTCLLSTFFLSSAGINAAAQTTELTANFQSDYVLNIPANQTITERNAEIGNLFVTGDIAPNQVVDVSVTTNKFVRVGSNDDLDFTLKYDNSSKDLSTYAFSEADIQKDSEKKLDLWTDITENDWSNAKAGEYNGSIIFTANLTDQPE